MVRAFAVRCGAVTGGYSGGFEDGPWACFNPMRSFVGPIGGAGLSVCLSVTVKIAVAVAVAVAFIITILIIRVMKCIIFSPPTSLIVTGVRSRLEVDRNHLRAFHNAVMVCVNESAWSKPGSVAMDNTEVRSFDLGDVQVCVLFGITAPTSSGLI